MLEVANTPDTVRPSAWGPIFPITVEKGETVLEAADKAGHKITRVFGYNNALTSDHRFKQCVDFMHYGDAGMRIWLENFLVENSKNLGVMGLISNRRCMGFPSNETHKDDTEVYWGGPEGQWRNYRGSDPHTDHVHVQFNTVAVKGSRVDPSTPKKPVGPTSGEVYLDRLKPGTEHSDSVWYFRMAMNAISFQGGSELPLNRNFDDPLVHETKLFQQQRCNDKPDGWPGPKQTTLAFQLAQREMQTKGVHSLQIFRDSNTGGLVDKVW